MILNGTSIQSQGLKEAQQATVSIAQLLQFNISSHQQPGSTSVVIIAKLEKCHLTQRIHKRDLVEILFNLGLSIFL